MNVSDIPGFPQAVAALKNEGYDTERAAHLAVVVLRATTMTILAAALADTSDAILTEAPEWLDGPVVAGYLDAMSARIQERTGQ